jgi:spore coat protein U-like protein
MNKTISNLRSGLAAVVTVGLILGTASVARAADTDGSKSLTLSGTITPVATIEIATESGYNALAISVRKTDVKVATVTEVCNSESGYTVALQSANAVGGVAKLLGTSTSTNSTFTYTMTYGSHPVVLDPGTQIDLDVTGSTGGPTPQTGTVRDLKVSWLAQAVFADTYSDTLTLTITAK